jgi:phage shock protein E
MQNVIKSRKTILVLLIGVAILIVGVFFMSQNNASFMDTYKAEKNAMLIDIRTPEEFSQGHIAGAVNIDFYSPDFVSALTDAVGQKTAFIYCRSGSRSSQAKTQLEAQGIQVVAMEGGLMAYEGDLVQ